jgi:hypothetical protein
VAHVKALADAIFAAIGRRVNDPDLVHLMQRDVPELLPESVEAEVPAAEEATAGRTCLARLFSSCTVFTSMTVAEKDRVFRHFLGTIVSHEWSIPE